MKVQARRDRAQTPERSKKNASSANVIPPENFTALLLYPSAHSISLLSVRSLASDDGAPVKVW